MAVEISRGESKLPVNTRFILQVLMAAILAAEWWPLGRRIFTQQDNDWCRYSRNKVNGNVMLRNAT